MTVFCLKNLDRILEMPSRRSRHVGGGLQVSRRQKHEQSCLAGIIKEKLGLEVLERLKRVIFVSLGCSLWNLCSNLYSVIHYYIMKDYWYLNFTMACLSVPMITNLIFTSFLLFKKKKKNFAKCVLCWLFPVLRYIPNRTNLGKIVTSILIFQNPY